jgi:hypothetical protein
MHAMIFIERGATCTCWTPSQFQFDWGGKAHGRPLTTSYLDWKGIKIKKKQDPLATSYCDWRKKLCTHWTSSLHLILIDWKRGFGTCQIPYYILFWLKRGIKQMLDCSLYFILIERGEGLCTCRTSCLHLIFIEEGIRNMPDPLTTFDVDWRRCLAYSRPFHYNLFWLKKEGS